MTQLKKKITIIGSKVHDVGYRLFLMEKAEELNIPNLYIKNLKINGKQIVEVLAGGERDGINIFIEFAKDNFPENAEVEDVSAEGYDGEIMTLNRFSGIFSVSQLSKIAQVGVGMLQKQDKTIERIDSFHKDTVQRFDRMDAKYDKVSDRLDKIDKTLEKLTDVLITIVKSLASQKTKK